MKETIDISCPVSPDRINENVARSAAFFTIVITLAGLFINNPLIFTLLAIDFSIRAFTTGKGSFIKYGSKKVVKFFGIKEKPVDAAPKKFAAGLGMAFCFIIAVFQVSGYYFAANVTGGILLFCAVLEGAFGICLGCIVYSFFIFSLIKK